MNEHEKIIGICKSEENLPYFIILTKFDQRKLINIDDIEYKEMIDEYLRNLVKQSVQT